MRKASGRAKRLLQAAEGVAYWAAAAPALARLPAAVGYRVACWRGDWLWRGQPGKRAELARNLRRVLGTELTPAAEHELTREWFRNASCEALDIKRLRGNGLALRRLVQIRGQEHLDAALAQGNGAIVCSAHFGSFDGAFSMLGACGFPVTTIGRWQHNYTTGISPAERRFWDRVYAEPLRRHRKRPNIEPWTGRFDVAARAASALRAGEVLTIAIDAPPLESDLTRAVEVPFLSRRARLLPGAVAIAQATKAPVLMCFAYRRPDYRHQVLEISPAIPMDGDMATAFGRCTAAVSAAIARKPAHWRYWASPVDLATLGLLPAEPEDTPSLAARPLVDVALPPSPEAGGTPLPAAGETSLGLPGGERGGNRDGRGQPVGAARPQQTTPAGATSRPAALVLRPV
jgi:lauroyl/myristoyl acyltransferase